MNLHGEVMLAEAIEARFPRIRVTPRGYFDKSAGSILSLGRTAEVDKFVTGWKAGWADRSTCVSIKGSDRHIAVNLKTVSGYSPQELAERLTPMYPDPGMRGAAIKAFLLGLASAHFLSEKKD